MKRKNGFTLPPEQEADAGAPFMPTTDEIAEARDAIRDSWDDAERKKRYCGWLPERWTPPIVEASEIQID